MSHSDATFTAANGRPAGGHSAAWPHVAGRTVDWAGYPALFQRVSPTTRDAAPVEIKPEPIPAIGRTTGVREAFLGFCQAALFSPGATPRPDRPSETAAARALAAAEEFGFTRDEIRRLGCGLYTGPAAVRDDLRSVGFADTEIDAARLACDETGRPRTELTGCLVVPLTDEAGRLGDFLLLTIDDTGRVFSAVAAGSPDPAARRTAGLPESLETYGQTSEVVGKPRHNAGCTFSGYRFLYGSANSNIVAFGLHTALARPEGRDSLILVDDVLECLLLQCRGLHHVAAVGGSGHDFSPRRWEELARLGARTVTLAFRRDDRHAAGIRDALVGALRARTAPAVFVANPYPGGQRSAADVLRRFGKDTCDVALSARSLAFHDKDFGAEERAAYAVAPRASAEPHYRMAYRMHVAELAAALPAEDRAVAGQVVASVESAIALGDLARAAWLIDGAASVCPSAWTGRLHTAWQGELAARCDPPSAAPPAAWPHGWTAPPRPAPFGTITCWPLPQTDGGRTLLLALRDWLRRESEAAYG